VEDKETFEKAHFSDAFKVLESILNPPSLVWISEKIVRVEKTSELMSTLIHCIQCMGLDKRDTTFIANKQNHKSLIQRHYDAKLEKKVNVANPVESPDKDDASRTMLRRGTVVDVNVGKGKTKHYAITGISQKFSNKWFHIRATDEHPYWPATYKKEQKKYRFHMREVVSHPKKSVPIIRRYNTISDSRKYRKREDKVYIQVENVSEILAVHGVKEV